MPEKSSDDYSNSTVQTGDYSKKALQKVNVSDTETLDGLLHKSYKFNMKSRLSPDYDKFYIHIDNLSSKKQVEYMIIIEEDNNVIFRKIYTSAVNLKVNAEKASKYKVTILNTNTKKLRYRIRINH